MKITKSQLKEIVKEELEQLEERMPRRRGYEGAGVQQFGVGEVPAGQAPLHSADTETAIVIKKLVNKEGNILNKIAKTTDEGMSEITIADMESLKKMLDTIANRYGTPSWRGHWHDPVNKLITGVMENFGDIRKALLNPPIELPRDALGRPIAMKGEGE